jgi:diaminohydroxyphosphoribosylaminopyrimidine deaminase/5-amino-6-(5-phosphoribosylamino)uracil reductase
VDEIAKLPLKEVIYGAIDPNPLVSGNGIAFLEKRNIRCTYSEFFDVSSAHLLEQFKWALHNKTPYVGLKSAISLNGMSGFPNDKKVWITSERARHYGHWLRMCYDAILVGANTVILDNPILNVRHPKLIGRTPLRIVLDPNGRALLSRPFSECNLLSIEPEKTLWVCKTSFWKSAEGIKALEVLQSSETQIHALDNDWSLQGFLKELGARECGSLLLEGGEKVWGSFLNEGLVNKAHLFFAPKLFSKQGTSFMSSFENDFQLSLKPMTLTSLDEDLLIEGSICVEKGVR